MHAGLLHQMGDTLALARVPRKLSSAAEHGLDCGRGGDLASYLVHHLAGPSAGGKWKLGKEVVNPASRAANVCASRVRDRFPTGNAEKVVGAYAVENGAEQRANSDHSRPIIIVSPPSGCLCLLLPQVLYLRGREVNPAGCWEPRSLVATRRVMWVGSSATSSFDKNL